MKINTCEEGAYFEEIVKEGIRNPMDLAKW